MVISSTCVVAVLRLLWGSASPVASFAILIASNLARQSLAVASATTSLSLRWFRTEAACNAAAQSNHDANASRGSPPGCSIAQKIPRRWQRGKSNELRGCRQIPRGRGMRQLRGQLGVFSGRRQRGDRASQTASAKAERASPRRTPRRWRWPRRLGARSQRRKDELAGGVGRNGCSGLPQRARRTIQPPERRVHAGGVNATYRQRSSAAHGRRCRKATVVRDYLFLRQTKVAKYVNRTPW